MKPENPPIPTGPFVLDLTPPLEELRGRLDKKWRNQLTRSEKNNLTVVSGHGREEYRSLLRDVLPDAEAQNV